VLLILVAACTPAPDSGEAGTCHPVGPPEALDAHGGHPGVAREATGWWRTERICERWWLITPEGHPAWSNGVNHATPTGDVNAVTGEQAYATTTAAAYASPEAWAEATASRLQGWGINTVGAWSDDDLLRPWLSATPILNLSGGDWQSGSVADWYDPAWEASVEATVAAVVVPRADDPNVLGWFLDNEGRWGPDWRGQATLLQLYLQTDAAAPGKQAAVAFLLDRLGGVEGVNGALGTAYADEAAMRADTGAWDALDADAPGPAADLTTAWLQATADRYFSVTTSAIRAADPNHLILGNREVSVLTRLEVYQAAAPYVDVLSINNYTFQPGVDVAAIALSGAIDPADAFAALHAEVDLPVLISEFGFRAADSGLPNTWPPIYPTLDTQSERAAAAAAYIEQAQQTSWIVGQHWFEWVDEPMDGRFDGEDNNWGLVNEQDEPYTELTEAMRAVNLKLWERLETADLP